MFKDAYPDSLSMIEVTDVQVAPRMCLAGRSTDEPSARLLKTECTLISSWQACGVEGSFTTTGSIFGGLNPLRKTDLHMQTWMNR